MKNIEEIKSELRAIQSNFNPQKETYKIINEIIEQNMKAKEILEKLKQIKGTNKYPEEIKYKYNTILTKVKEIVFEEQKEEEKHDEQTRELKTLIETLEKNKLKKEIEKPKTKEKSKEEYLSENNNINQKEDEEEIKNAFQKGRKLFNILLTLVIFSALAFICLLIFL